MFDPFSTNFFGRTIRSLSEGEISRSDPVADFSPPDDARMKREDEQRSSFRYLTLPPSPSSA
jgi:hypothetical protein